jgi:hypothetical protein
MTIALNPTGSRPCATTVIPVFSHRRPATGQEQAPGPQRVQITRIRLATIGIASEHLAAPIGGNVRVYNPGT